jgi:hypothetical protein
MNLSNGTRVYYVTITGIEQAEQKTAIKVPANKKRYVIKTDGELGMESGEYDEEKDKWTTVWYIWDKVKSDIVEGYSYSGEGSKSMAKRDADKMNIEAMGS